MSVTTRLVGYLESGLAGFMTTWKVKRVPLRSRCCSDPGMSEGWVWMVAEGTKEFHSE